MITSLTDEEGCATCRATRQWCADPYHASSFDEDDLRAELAEMDEGRRSAITLWQMAVRSESTPPDRYALASIIAEKMGHERSDDSPTCMDEDTTLGCRHANGHPAEPGCDTCCEYGWPCAPALAAADAVLAAALAIVPRVPTSS